MIELQVGVKALLQNKDGKFLLLYRSPVKYPDIKGDRWDIVGGRIVPGTPLLENLKREIKEEIGLELVDTPRLVAAQDILRVSGKHVVRLTYVGLIDGEPVLGDEHDEYRWFSREELNTLASLDLYFKELLGREII
ncbi:MAG: NUDIX domain-containing protein [bacterium]|nr:NUDIX domain-containing protein [bacterium]